VHDQKFSGGGQEPFVEERQDVSTRSYALAPPFLSDGLYIALSQIPLSIL
jgi:hypothetical protein